uniref:Myb/SANT-like domain-containing protein n=1 Tax=Zea mays TaxID=4577 RepID=C0PF25_MAIZE|nr:unknown [Zea mays]
MEAGHSGQVQQARGIVVQVRDGNLEPALSIMERKMRSSGTERLIRAHTLLDIKDSENRLLALKELMQRVRSQELMLRKIVIKQIRTMEEDNADWCDENVKIACEIFAEEVRAKNRSGSHLNKLGYNNVMVKFKERTGKTYSELQFKNKWDKLKKDYSNWKQLGKETGCGWDPNKKLYVAPDWWWEKANIQFKGISKFKDKSLQNAEELSVMFEDLRNTGDDHWVPTSGELPQDTEAQIHDAINIEDENASDCGEDTPSSSTSKRRRVVVTDKGKKPKTTGGQWMQDQMSKLFELNKQTTTSCESMVLARTQETPGSSIKDVMQLDKGKKPKTTGGQWMQDQMSKLVELNKQTTSCESMFLARTQETPGSSIKDVMQLVKACGAIAGSKEHFIATQVLTKKNEREMFLTLDTPEERFQWLSMKYEWMTMNKKG